MKKAAACTHYRTVTPIHAERGDSIILRSPLYREKKVKILSPCAYGLVMCVTMPLLQVCVGNFTVNGLSVSPEMIERNF